MAVVMDEGTVYAFADDTEVTEGRTLLADGAVIEAESESRGIGGLVRDGSGAARGVWVQVVGRELTAECDGPCALASGRLCRHAVALALHAVERRLPWHAAPVDDTPCAPGEALDALTAVEKAAVLDRLLDARPELRAEADQLAVHLLAPRARVELTALQEGTAAEVEQALRTLDSDHLSTGYRPGFGYTDVYEAASRLIEPIIEQYEADVRRRLALGMPDAAEAVALGVLDGLDACEGDYDGDEVLCYAGESRAETYGYKIRELMRTAGRAVE
ncbi:hypothetical protein SLV14_004692 [Streptomyces sp. Je 1-4]|uniref:hypothetical protein n=1 Tax=Streptomyces TaxID=1883 RepID=UPI0021D94DBF|nr:MULTISPECIES: hypothetical protein [unclassified Streptomyces]UYB41886.1 hypothetical protein SLV14_004692 [Streptomyces sp. Je 1-4]UZQ38153.1 hypothetical protein SLV14N_004692 [Streptomyces sp. Je 1-4] [Streptomyces sp. Je 1-4 4N24]UZQ45570.1 hypothetical protein SLV14NA_004692 [Streptomyces sp. Je 1-4] [Streptomyces sp. Je 1-4 4N24_ara]